MTAEANRRISQHHSRRSKPLRSIRPSASAEIRRVDQNHGRHLRARSCVDDGFSDAFYKSAVKPNRVGPLMCRDYLREFSLSRTTGVPTAQPYRLRPQVFDYIDVFGSRSGRGFAAMTAHPPFSFRAVASEVMCMHGPASGRERRLFSRQYTPHIILFSGHDRRPRLIGLVCRQRHRIAAWRHASSPLPLGKGDG
jgi:hypothetical protein